MTPARIGFLLAAGLAVFSALATAAEPPSPRPLPVTPGLDLTWWHGFGDPQLDALWVEALAANPDVKTVAARLGMAETVLESLQAEGRLSLDANASIGARSYPYTRHDREILPDGPGLALRYDVDLWGRRSTLEKIGAAQRQAAAEDLNAARLALVAEVAETWTALRANAGRLDLLAKRRSLAEQLLALRQARVKAGFDTPETTLYQAADLAALDQAKAELDLERMRLLHHLDALRGLASTSTPPPVPPLEEEPAALLPATLDTGRLESRPEVRAATLRLGAAQDRAGVARAGRLPSLGLVAEGFFTGNSLREFVRGGSLAGFLAAQMTAPLLDGGRNRDRLDAARAELTLAGTEYAAVVTRVFEESADAADNVRSGRAALAAARRALDACAQAAAIVRHLDDHHACVMVGVQPHRARHGFA